MFHSPLAADGRTTVPQEIRELIGAGPGTRLVWHVMTGGAAIVRAEGIRCSSSRVVSRRPRAGECRSRPGAQSEGSVFGPCCWSPSVRNRRFRAAPAPLQPFVVGTEEIGKLVMTLALRRARMGLLVEGEHP